MSDKTIEDKKAEPVNDEVPLQATEDVLIEETEIPKSSKKGKTSDDKGKTSDDKGKAKKTTDEIIKGAAKNEIHWKTIDPIIKVSFVVFILACAVVIGNTIIDKNFVDHSSAPIEYTETVNVEYVGSFYAYYTDSGAVVFDTNIKNVAESEDYAKSYEFTKDDSYTKLEVDIEDGDLLKMFREAVIGHKVGDTVKVTIPASEGYGELTDSEKGHSAKTGATISTSCFMTADDYESFFGSSAPSSGETIVKSPYGWDARVTADNDGVTVQYMPNSNLETEYTLNDACKLKVTSVNSETITYDYIFEYSNQMIQTVVDNTTVYIIGVDDTGFDYKTTKETVGETLYFVIKIVE